jgi:hypothetical protein
MPTWIEKLIADVTPLTSKAAGLVKIGEAVIAEYESQDDAASKTAKILGDIAEAAEEIDGALNAHT